MFIFLRNQISSSNDVVFPPSPLDCPSCRSRIVTSTAENAIVQIHSPAVAWVGVQISLRPFGLGFYFLAIVFSTFENIDWTGTISESFANSPEIFELSVYGIPAAICVVIILELKEIHQFLFSCQFVMSSFVDDFNVSMYLMFKCFITSFWIWSFPISKRNLISGRFVIPTVL